MKLLIKVDKIVLEKMINVLEEEGIFFEGQFDDGLIIGNDDISSELIDLIKANSNIKYLFCATNKGVEWNYYIYNPDIIDPMDVDKIAIRKRNCR